MTLLALTAELAEMNVVLLVTCGAIARERNLRSGFAMALSALQLLVRARQRKLSLRMVEFPELPAIRGVAVIALGTEIASMNIAVRVTSIAGGIGPREGMIRMAACARRDHVHADEREWREIVIEADCGAPGIVTMALLACRPRRTGVNIVQLVTRAALFADRMILERAAVTAMACNVPMAAEQCEVRIA